MQLPYSPQNVEDSVSHTFKSIGLAAQVYKRPSKNIWQSILALNAFGQYALAVPFMSIVNEKTTPLTLYPDIPYYSHAIEGIAPPCFYSC